MKTSNTPNEEENVTDNFVQYVHTDVLHKQ